ncbi:MAG: hypothetical protein QXQ90_05340 [Desulfurococcaceae archaeon]
MDNLVSLTISLVALMLLAGLAITVIDLLSDLAILVNNVIKYGTYLYRDILSFNDTYTTGMPTHDPSLEVDIANLTSEYCEYLSESIRIAKTVTLGVENKVIEQLVRKAEKLGCNLTYYESFRR